MHGNRLNPPMEDHQLWSEIRDNSEDAFKTLFYRYYEQLVAFAYRLVENESLAKDIGQEVFVKVWDRRSSLDIKDSVRAYLLRAARNTALNHLKKKRFAAIEDQLEPEDSNAGALQQLQAVDLDKGIQAAINGLPAACKTVFLLKHFEGLSLKEIARELEISPKTVENQLTKARKIIMNYIKPMLTIVFFITSIPS